MNHRVIYRHEDGLWSPCGISHLGNEVLSCEREHDEEAGYVADTGGAPFAVPQDRVGRVLDILNLNREGMT